MNFYYFPPNFNVVIFVGFWWTVNISSNFKTMFCKMIIIMGYWMAMNNFAALFLKRVQISEIPHTCISNVYQIFIFHPIWCIFFVELILLRTFGSMLTNFLYFVLFPRQKLKRKGLISANFKIWTFLFFIQF